jgi:tubulin gamma
MAPLIPLPKFHFLQTGYTPLTDDNAIRHVQKTSVTDVMRRLLQPKSMMVSTMNAKNADHIDHAFISALSIIQGDVDANEVVTMINYLVHLNGFRCIVVWRVSKSVN